MLQFVLMTPVFCVLLSHIGYLPGCKFRRLFSNTVIVVGLENISSCLAIYSRKEICWSCRIIKFFRFSRNNTTKTYPREFLARIPIFNQKVARVQSNFHMPWLFLVFSFFFFLPEYYYKFGFKAMKYKYYFVFFWFYLALNIHSLHDDN